MQVNHWFNGVQWYVQFVGNAGCLILDNFLSNTFSLNVNAVVTNEAGSICAALSNN